MATQNFDPNEPVDYSGPMIKRSDQKFDPSAPIDYTPPISTFSPEWRQDVATQAGTGLARGAAQLLALPGTAVQAGNWLSDKVRDIYGNYQENTGAIPKGTTAQAAAQRQAQQEAAMTFGEKAGRSTSVYGLQLPTSEGVDWVLKNKFGMNFPEAKTDTGRYVNAAMQMVPATVLTGGGGLAARVGIGAASGLGAQGAEDVAGLFDAGDTTKAIAGFGGALAGGLAGSAGANKIAGILSPGKTAIKDLAQSVSLDAAGGKSNILKTVDPATGLPLVAGTTMGQNIYGPNAARTIGRAGNVSEKAGIELGAVNQNIAERSADIPRNLGTFVKDTTGVTAAAPELVDGIEAATRQHITDLYSIAQNHPAAQNMVSPELSKAMRGDMMASLAKRVESLSTAEGSPIIPATLDANGDFVGGNIHFYDRIGKMLRDDIQGAKPYEAKDFIEARKRLLGAVDFLVPQYNTARGAAFDNFAQQNSVELGFKSLAAKDQFKLHDIKQAFNESPSEHQEMFKQGLGYALQSVAEKDGPQGLLKYINDPPKLDFLKTTLGEPAVEAIQGRATADKFLSDVKQYQPLMQAPSRVQDIALGGLGTNVANNLAAGNLSAAALSGLGYAGTKVLGSLSHFGENKKAMEILRLISSSDPKDMQMFYRMVKNDTSTQSILQKILEQVRSAALRRAPIIQGELDQQSQDSAAPRTTRKTGGKVSDNAKHDRLLGRLMALTEKAKRTEEAATKPLLNAPDEAIVHALHVANAAI